MRSESFRFSPILSSFLASMCLFLILLTPGVFFGTLLFGLKGACLGLVANLIGLCVIMSFSQEWIMQAHFC